MRHGKREPQRDYVKYREQIDTLASLPNMKIRQIARIIAWFYGGQEEGWRKIFASKGRKKRMPEDVRNSCKRLGRLSAKHDGA